MFRTEAGDSVDRFAAMFAGNHLSAVALNAKTLGYMRKVQIIIEFGAGPDTTPIQAAMGFLNGDVFRGEKRQNLHQRCPDASRTDCP